MRRLAILLAAAVSASGGLAPPLCAQKALLPASADADRDGVADVNDRCPNTPAGARVGPDGCPPAAMPARADTSGRATGATKGRRATPVLVGLPGTASRDSATATTRGGLPSPPPTGGRALVAPQSVQPGAQPPPAAGGAAPSGYTAGLAMPAFGGSGVGARVEYARRLAQMLDSAIVTLVGVFRNTSGQPLGGATGPSALSQRERDRWLRCRDVYWDLTTYGEAVRAIRDSLPADATLERAAAALDTVLSELEATAECDNVASMIAAPERWDPWQEHYEAAARRFYRDWYTQARGVHERDRAFVVALNAVLPVARRLPVPAALPRNPPYAGAAPR